MYLIESFNEKEDDKLIDIENGGIYECLIDSELQIHEMFQCLYEMDKKEILTESVGDLKNKIKNGSSNILTNIKNTILSVINSILNFIDKMRFNIKKFTEKYGPIVSKMDIKTDIVEIEGYKFTNNIGILDINKFFNVSYQYLTRSPREFVKKHSGKNLVEVFNEKSSNVIEIIKDIMCEINPSDNKKETFENRIHAAVFGSNEKKKIKIHASDALSDMGMYLSNRLKTLRKQKIDCNKAFDDAIKKMQSDNDKEISKITSLFVQFFNQVKVLYIKVLNEFIKGTKAYILQCQQVVKIAVKNFDPVKASMDKVGDNIKKTTDKMAQNQKDAFDKAFAAEFERRKDELEERVRNYKSKKDSGTKKEDKEKKDE